MRFEERELKPYSEPISPEELRLGHVYFAVLFLDNQALVPVMQPKVFIGRDLEPGDASRFYFQDFDSYKRGVRFEFATEEDGAIFETGAERHTFIYEKALDVLMCCALRRRQADGEG